MANRIVFEGFSQGQAGDVMRYVFGCSCVAVFAILSLAGRPSAAEPGVDAAYKEWSDRLEEKDAEGHYRLAEWCRQQGRYDLAAREARKVLAVEPKHERAAALLRAAERKRREQGTSAPSSRPAGAASSRLLSDADVQKLRWGELRAAQSGAVEPVRVEFAKGFAEKFLRDLASDADRERFRRAQAAEKFQMVIAVTETVDAAYAKYADQIRIVDDPTVFREFRRVVLPEVMKGCATPACHGGSVSKGFRLVNEPRHATRTLYTNFFIVQWATGKDGRPVIDRKEPEGSLLLQYLLPAGEAQVSHPPAQVPIKPMVRGRNDRTYRAILDWIRSLRPFRDGRSDYGIQYGGAEPPAASRPATRNAERAGRSGSGAGNGSR